MIYLISYYKMPSFDFGSLDLFGNKNALAKEIQSYSGWCKCFDTAWLIATTDDIETVSTRLTKLFDKNDFWLIAAISEQICGGLSTAAWDWIKSSRSNGF